MQPLIMDTNTMTYGDVSRMRRNMCFNISCWSLFGVLTICWGGVIYMHEHFLEYNNDSKVWTDYKVFIIFNYITMGLFLLTWIPVVLFIKWADNPYARLLLCCILSTFTLADSIFLQTINYDIVGHNEYKNISLLIGIVQFVIITTLNCIMLKGYNYTLPTFCIAGKYTPISQTTNSITI